MKIQYGMTLTLAAAVLAGPVNVTAFVLSPLEAPPPHNERKNRYVSFAPSNPGVVTAYRVELTASALFPDSTGVVGWVSTPFDPGCPNVGDPPEDCAGEYVARLECVPVFRVWDEEYVHVGHPTIAPASVYGIRAFDEAENLSIAFIVETSPKPDHRNWGDVVGPADPVTLEWTGPDGFANVLDIQAAVLRMQMLFNPAPLTWIDVHDLTPNYIINISDVQLIKWGVIGEVYPFIDPAIYIHHPAGCEDCNSNGACDMCELEDGSATDCNGNGIPDVCDINSGFSNDCLPDGVPDECEPDCNNNTVADACDIADGSSMDCNFNAIPDDCEPDCNGNGVPDDCDVSPFWPFLDGDGDRLLDVCEVVLGTDPNQPDSDGDGISDGDEVLGTVDGLDLPAMGANPNRKTLFVEVDWFEDDAGIPPHSHRPSDSAVEALVVAFAAAPVANPDPSFPTGIELIVDYGQDVGEPAGVFTGGNRLPDDMDANVEWPREFDQYKAEHFAPERLGYFRYGIHAHRHSCSGCSQNSSGIAEQPGDDFMVTLQTLLDDIEVSQTMMHELGHNLGLWHGGFEEKHYKPNYNSVMNYRYQFSGVDIDCDALGDFVLDYSHGLHPDLDENNLDELAGVCGVACDPACPIDWNDDQTISSGVRYSISCFEGMTSPCGAPPPDSRCDDSCDLLQDHDDWANLQYSILQANRSTGETVECQSVTPTSTRSLVPGRGRRYLPNGVPVIEKHVPGNR